jgi:hypothetical protein
MNPLLTKSELAERICQSSTYIDQRLSLVKLRDSIQALVNDGKIHLTNAYALAKLPPEEQDKFVEQAIADGPKIFVPLIKGRVKELRDAKRAGQDAQPVSFKPVQYLQKLNDVKSELEALSGEAGSSKIATLIQTLGIDDVLVAAQVAIAWVLHYDEESKAEQARRDEIKKAKMKDRMAQLKTEREAKKAEMAQAVAADLTKL